MGLVLLNCSLGLVHPPIGLVQLIGCAIGETSKTAPPYYLAIFSAIDIVMCFASFSTWLPSLLR
jgi:TRAP-type C4-dicarboxylate transport system permease large subunit